MQGTVNLSPSFPCASFSSSYFSVLKNHPYKQLDVLFLTQFPLLTHNMPGVIIFNEKYSESNLVFFKHTVAPCQHHWIAAGEKCTFI